AEARAERDEAHAQQVATAEVLEVINASPGNLAPVFDVILDKALGLCGASIGILITYDGQRFHFVAQRGASAAFMQFVLQPQEPGPETGLGRLQAGEQVVHLPDLKDSEAYRSGDPLRRATVDLAGARTWLGVALRKKDALLGAIVLYRQEPEPFSDK